MPVDDSTSDKPAITLHNRLTDDFFWEVNEALESRYDTKRREAEENECTWWFVEHERVAVRDAPSPSAKMVDVLRKGALVQAHKIQYIDTGEDSRRGVRWLKLHPNEHQFFKTETGERTHAFFNQSCWELPCGAYDECLLVWTQVLCTCLLTASLLV